MSEIADKILFEPAPAAPGVSREVLEQCAEALERGDELYKSGAMGFGSSPQRIFDWVNEMRPALAAARAELEAGDGWIACTERLPTEADGDCHGRVWWFDASGEIDTQPYGNLVSHHAHYLRQFGAGPTHWRRTHLARPQPPTI